LRGLESDLNVGKGFRNLLFTYTREMWVTTICCKTAHLERLGLADQLKPMDPTEPLIFLRWFTAEVVLT